mgnify:CR=1 FL=1
MEISHDLAGGTFQATRPLSATGSLSNPVVSDAISGNNPNVSPSPVSEDYLASFRARVILALAELVELYLPQAKKPELVEKTPPKDALAIVKSALELMNDLSTASERTRQREKVASLRSPHPPSPSAFASSPGPSTQSESPISTPPTVDDLHRLIDNAVYEIAQMEEETKDLEGWARLLVRCDSLMKKLEKAICPVHLNQKSHSPTPKPQTAHPESLPDSGKPSPHHPEASTQHPEPQTEDANPRAP